MSETNVDASPFGLHAEALDRLANRWNVVCRAAGLTVGDGDDYDPTAELCRLLGEATQTRSALRDAHAFLARLEAGAVGGVCRVMYEAVRVRREEAGKVLGKEA